jgi:cytochrome c553
MNRRTGLRMAQLGVAMVTAAVAWGAFVTASAAANAPAARLPDAGRGQRIASQVCAACHGVDGNSPAGAFPSIAGQHASYLFKQLRDFKTQPGAKAPERNSPVMTGMVAGLGDADMADLAAYYASRAPRPTVAHDKATIALGQQIWRGGIPSKGVPACGACHGPAGAGIPAQYPRLGGQWQEYTGAQLVAFSQGVRVNSAPMRAIASRMSDAEIRAVADYAAGLR